MPQAGLNVSDDMVVPDRVAQQSFRERRSAPELAHAVASVWVLEVGAEGAEYEHRTAPNGSVEISCVLGSDRLVVSGPQRGPLIASVAPGTTVIGIRFHPGAAPAVLGPPASELLDLCVDLDGLWGARGAILAEQLAEADTPERALQLVEDTLTRRLSESSEPDPLVAAAIGRLQPWLSRGIDALASDLYVSPRQLHRRFVAALGFGPKRLERILRLQAFLALTHGPDQPDIGLAFLAQIAGYADQSHLTREVVALTGMTPGVLLEETRKNCGANHDHGPSYASLRHALLAGG
jgi:AraC-like DNA-binding protein